LKPPAATTWYRTALRQVSTRSRAWSAQHNFAQHNTTMIAQPCWQHSAAHNSDQRWGYLTQSDMTRAPLQLVLTFVCHVVWHGMACAAQLLYCMACLPTHAHGHNGCDVHLQTGTVVAVPASPVGAGWSAAMGVTAGQAHAPMGCVHCLPPAPMASWTRAREVGSSWTQYCDM
jgi:hypothetical protein